MRLSRSMVGYRPALREDTPVVAVIERHIAANPRDGFGPLYDALSLAGRTFGKTLLWRVYAK